MVYLKRRMICKRSIQMPQKCAIVTGGARGIGKEIASRLLTDGFSVVIADIQEKEGRRCAQELKQLGRLVFVPADVADETQVKNIIKTCIQSFGSINLLVNNAAVSANKKVEELTLKEWNRVINTNLTGAFLCAKHAAPHLKKQGGSIINIASTRAYMSEADTEAYSASKGGLFALTHALAISLGPKVRVNSISPGWIDTKEWIAGKLPPLTMQDHQQHPAGRVGKPEDIASLVSWLAGKESGFVTGADFIVDGGMTKKMIYL